MFTWFSTTLFTTLVSLANERLIRQSVTQFKFILKIDVDIFQHKKDEERKMDCVHITDEA